MQITTQKTCIACPESFADEDDVDKITGTTDTAWAVPDSFKSFLESVWHAGRESVVTEVEKEIRNLTGDLIDETPVMIKNQETGDYSCVSCGFLPEKFRDELITKLSELKEKK